MGGDNLHLAALHCVVVLVGVWSDLTLQQKHPSPRRRSMFKAILFLLIQGWCLRQILIYGEFRVGHEVVDGILVPVFLKAHRTMERSDHFYLYQGKEKEDEKIGGENWPTGQGNEWLEETKPKL